MAADVSAGVVASWMIRTTTSSGFVSRKRFTSPSTSENDTAPSSQKLWHRKMLRCASAALEARAASAWARAATVGSMFSPGGVASSAARSVRTRRASAPGTRTVLGTP